MYIPGRCAITIIICNSDDRIHRKYIGGFKLTKSQEKTNHQMYMDGIKLFDKNEK